MNTKSQLSDVDWAFLHEALLYDSVHGINYRRYKKSGQRLIDNLCERGLLETDSAHVFARITDIGRAEYRRYAIYHALETSS